jgi:hypothetical protein
MASIEFDATLNIDGLLENIDTAEISFAEWVDRIVKGYAKIDDIGKNLSPVDKEKLLAILKEYEVALQKYVDISKEKSTALRDALGKPIEAAPLETTKFDTSAKDLTGKVDDLNKQEVVIPVKTEFTTKTVTDLEKQKLITEGNAQELTRTIVLAVETDEPKLKAELERIKDNAQKGLLDLAPVMPRFDGKLIDQGAKDQVEKLKATIGEPIVPPIIIDREKLKQGLYAVEFDLQRALTKTYQPEVDPDIKAVQPKLQEIESDFNDIFKNLISPDFNIDKVSDGLEKMKAKIAEAVKMMPIEPTIEEKEMIQQLYSAMAKINYIIAKNPALNVKVETELKAKPVETGLDKLTAKVKKGIGDVKSKADLNDKPFNDKIKDDEAKVKEGIGDVVSPTVGLNDKPLDDGIAEDKAKVKDGLGNMPPPIVPPPDLDPIEARLRETEKVAYDVIDKINTEYQKILDSANYLDEATKKAIEEQHTLVLAYLNDINEITKELAKAQKEGLDTTGTRAELDQTVAGFQEELQNLMDMKQEAIKVNGELAASQDEENKSTGAGGILDDLLSAGKEKLMGVLKKYGGILGALTIAQQVFTKTIQNSKALGERWAETTSMMGGAMKEFWRGFKDNPDFALWISYIIQGAKAAKDFTHAMNQYNNSKSAEAVISAQEEVQLSKLLNIYEDEKSSVAEKQKAYKDYTDIVVGSADRQLKAEEAVLQASTKRVKNIGGLGWINEKDVEMATKIYGLFPDLMSMADEWAKTDKPTFFGMGGTSDVEMMEKTKAMAKELGVSWEEVFAALQIKAKMSDEDFAALQERFIAYAGAAQTAADATANVTANLGELDDVAPEGSIGNLDKIIGDYQKAFDIAPTESQRQSAAFWLKYFQDIRDSMAKVAEDNGAAGSLKRLSAEMSDLQEKYDDATTNKERQQIWNQMEAKQREYDAKDVNYATEKARAKKEFEKEQGEARKDLALQIEQDLLNIQRDSAQRARDQAELDYRQTIRDLDKRKADLIEKQNLASGGLIETKAGLVQTTTYVPTLQGTDAEQDSKLRLDAEKKLAFDTIEINRDASDQIKYIYRDIADVFINEEQRQTNAINDKYDQMVLNAEAASADLKVFQDIEKGRQAELTQNAAAAALYFSDYYDKAFNHIADQGYKTLKKLAADTKNMLTSAMDIGGGNFEVWTRELDEQGNVIKKIFTTEELDSYKDKLREILDLIGDSNPFEGMKNSWKGLKDAIKNGKDIAVPLRSLNDYADQAIATFGELAGTFEDLFGQAEQGKVEAMVEALSGMKDMAVGIARIASGDIIGGITQTLEGIGKLVDGLDKLFNKTTKALAALDKVIAKQERSLELAARTGDEANKRQDLIDSYQKKLELLNSRMDKLNDWWRPVWKKGDKIASTKKDIEELIMQIEDAQLAYEDFLTGGITQNTIADVIAQGFEDGKTSVDDFAKYMNDVLWDAMMNVFKTKILGKQIDQIVAFIESSMGEDDETSGFLSKEEVATIDKMVADAAKYSKEVYDKVFGSLKNPALEQAGSTVGLSGQIMRNITEDTGTELAGLMRKIADDNRKNLLFNQLTADHLWDVIINTAQTVMELQNVEKLLAGGAITTTPVQPTAEQETPAATAPYSNILEDLAKEPDLLRIMAEDGRINRDYNGQSVDHLINIEANTFNTVAELKLAVAELKVIAEKTNPQLEPVTPDFYRDSALPNKFV